MLALSDHDTVDGVDEALAAGALRGVRVVPATEISAVDGGYEDLHVLGYGIDHRSGLLARAPARCPRRPLAPRRGDGGTPARARFRDRPVSDQGPPGGGQAGRPSPTWPPRCSLIPPTPSGSRKEGHADVSSFIPAYLIQGMPGYVARTHPTVEEAIRWIHEAAGVAVWAHPFWDIKDEQEVLAAIDRYRGCGAGRRRGLLRVAYRGADAAARRSLRRGRPARHRLLRLPRTGTSPLQPLPRFQAARPRAKPGADRARHARRACPQRGGHLPLADRAIRVGQVDRRPTRRGPAARPRPPGRGARR